MSKASTTSRKSSLRTKSKEYQAFQNLYDDLVEAIIPEVDSIISKAWSKSMVGKQLLDSSHDVGTSKRQKASSFLSAIGSRLKLDSGTFDKFLSLLSEIESLHYMKERLEHEVNDLNSPCATDVHSNTSAQLPMLDLAEGIELLPVDDERENNPDQDHDIEELDASNDEDSEPLLSNEEHEEENSGVADGEKTYSLKEINSIKRGYFRRGFCCAFLTFIFLIGVMVGMAGIILGARIMSGEIACTNPDGTPIIVFNFYGLFVFFVGVTSLFITAYLSLVFTYRCFRVFDKCQSRAWRISLCVGVLFGILSLFLALGIFVFSVVIGITFYPAAEQGLAAAEAAGCSSFYFYIIFFFIAFTNAVGSVVVVVFVVWTIIVGIFRLIKRTIFTDD